VKRRILATILAVTALAILVFAVPLAVAAGRLYRSEELARLQAAATRAVVRVPSDTLGAGGPIALPDERHVTVAVYDVRADRVAGHGPDRGGPIVRRALGGRVASGSDAGRLVVAVPITDEQQAVGAATASTPASVITARTRRAWLGMGLIGALALATSYVVARRQSGRLVRPVAALARSLDDLGHGDFATRTPRSGIDELDEAAAALDATAARLGELVLRERTFSADASHQLSTPLTGLRLALEAAQLTPGSDLRQTVDEALAQVDRLETTITDLLALARDTRHDEPVDVAALIADAESDWHGPLARTGRMLRVDAPQPLPYVTGSRAAVRHALGVLLDNAAVHGAGTVTVRAYASSNGVVVEVEDEGNGLADPARAFQRRSPGARGHGIGLALARSLSEAEGGRLLLRRAAPRPLFALVLPGRSVPVS
jgi:signal transduction histidine kinase